MIDSSITIAQYDQKYHLPILNKLNQWYLQREQVGTEKTYGELEQRAQNLKKLLDIDAEKLNQMEKEIEKLEKIFENPSFHELINNPEIIDKIEHLKQQYETVFIEYENVLKSLYGDVE